MSLDVVGQRCVSEREPELGLGVVASVTPAHVGVSFPAAGEERLYTRHTPVLKRVRFRAGDTVVMRHGQRLQIESVAEEVGLLIYIGGGQRAREDTISDATSVRLPQTRLLAGQVDRGAVFDLRYRALQAQAHFRQSPVRGFLGGRLDLIPHQFFILHEVANRQIPRVLLADEVGLGKTIEACLIVQRMLAVGRAKRVLVLVPESLIHQWFVELLRRFNLWFGIYDEERCIAAETSAPQGNPFLGEQLALCSVGFLASREERRAQAIAAGWDLVVVDEAHHLAWSPEAVSAEYALVEQLARSSPGLLLLTATPTQLGLPGHFARLRLLDPDRYSDYTAFLTEAEAFRAVAAITERILDGQPLKPRDQTALQRVFRRDPVGLARHIAALDAGSAGAREALIRTLLDQHGPGRVMFRNTRAAMSGFPRRKFCPTPLASGGEATLLERIARELEAEETGHETSIRYSYRDDPRIGWLAAFLQKHKTAKVLLICRSQRKVAAIATALQEKLNVKIGFFHEGLPLVQRDRQAAWFAEPNGARLLLCSEIGSEGRNFQFAHDLVLFDLPLNHSLVEQRIGRLDRIGQKQTIQIHVPYLAGSADECVVEWYHRGLEAFEKPLHSGTEFVDQFRERLLALALRFGSSKAKNHMPELHRLLADTAHFRRELGRKMQEGRDRLLELHSYNPEIAHGVLDAIGAADADPRLRTLLPDVLEHFGVQIKEHEEGDLFLDPSHAFVEDLSAIPAEGTLVTFDRRRAAIREDIRFVSWDHPLVRDALDLLLNSPHGTTAFAMVTAEEPNLVLEAIFVLAAVADSRWHVDEFLAPTPLRVVVDVRAGDVSAQHPAGPLGDDTPDSAVLRFLERPQFNVALLKTMIDRATEIAETQAGQVRNHAMVRATDALGAEIQRLIDLRRVNDHVRAEEIDLARQHLGRIQEAIAQAGLRLDSLRLIVEGEPIPR